MAARADAPPWVIVAGGFHHRGGMDRANAALAAFLASTGTPVHLVAHEIDPLLGRHPSIVSHRVGRPRGMPALAESLLGHTAIRVARAVTRTHPAARVVVNGGNCAWPDVNWVHALHAAWPVQDHGARAWSRYRNDRLKSRAIRRERVALCQARVVIANSESTRRGIVERLGIPSDRVRTVYLGSDPSWTVVDRTDRLSARTALGLPAERPVVAFVGALGTDGNKGFDVLWEAWGRLRRSSGWDVHLLVAGAGWRLRHWQAAAARASALDSVHFVGFTPDVRRVLAASDLLVSPVRYEAYGLNVHEALCCGVPVMVTRTAGVTERFDSAMSDALLPEQITGEALADRLRRWREDVQGWRVRIEGVTQRLRARLWVDMAAELVELVADTPKRIPA